MLVANCTVGKRTTVLTHTLTYTHTEVCICVTCAEESDRSGQASHAKRYAKRYAKNFQSILIGTTSIKVIRQPN